MRRKPLKKDPRWCQIEPHDELLREIMDVVESRSTGPWYLKTQDGQKLMARTNGGELLCYIQK